MALSARLFASTFTPKKLKDQFTDEGFDRQFMEYMHCFYSLSESGSRFGSHVRASNEGSPRSRVARAQGIARPSSFPSITRSQYLREWPRLPSTARIERAHSDRARSASKEGTWPLPSLFHDPARAAGSRVTVSMASLRISTMRLSFGSDVLVAA